MSAPGLATARSTARDLLAQYLLQARKERIAYLKVVPTKYPAGQAIFAAEPAIQIAVLRVALAAVAYRPGYAYGSPVAMPDIGAGLSRLAEALEEVRRRATGAGPVAEMADEDDAPPAEWARELGGGLDVFEVYTRIGPLLSQLAMRRLPYSEADVRAILGYLSRVARWDELPTRALLRGVERWVKANGQTPEVRQALEAVRAAGATAATSAEPRKALALVEELLREDVPDAIEIDADDDWGALARPALDEVPAAERAAWLALLVHAATATASKPSATWRAEARRRVDALGEGRFVARAMSWLALLQAPPSSELRRGAGVGMMAGLDQIPRAVPTERNATLLRGLVWCCSLLEDEALARAVAAAGQATFKKIPEIGARSTRVGNACLYALGAMPGPHGAAQLVALQRQVKQPSARERLDATMDQAAERAGLTRDDLEDRAVPTHGLVDGCLRLAVGAYQAELVVRGAREVDVEWRDAAGAPLAEEPADLRQDHAAELQQLQRTAAEVRQTLLAQRDRVERLLASDRVWPLDAWRTHYLEHPLLATLARRLIWVFETDGRRTLGAWQDGEPASGTADAGPGEASAPRGAGALIDAADRPLTDLADRTVVRLWHPITSSADEVLAWRQWLQRHAVTQPFKQAHREIYLLTDAERECETYSNRFAEHILRQHQLQALCRDRGWRYALQGQFDGGGAVPTLVLPRWGLRAEYWVEPIEEDDMTTPNGIFIYVTTEQVRFTREAPVDKTAVRRTKRANSRAHLEALLSGDLAKVRAIASTWTDLQAPEETVPLADLPPVVFSEVMRDVDLFVGVASVGADPAGRDTAPERYGDYWERFSFGDLSASARTRQAVLESLLPRLAIGARCHLEDRFLVVRGDLRTYRIHLGSGNIQMEPNSQYLCIVPARGVSAPGTPGHLYLPFDGDTLLSVILSKAFLLADDRAIKDLSIMRQIRG